MTGVTLFHHSWYNINAMINSAFLPWLKASTAEQKTYKTSYLWVSVTACSDTNIQALHESHSTFQKVTVYHSAQNMLSIFLLFECLCSRRGSCLAVIRRSALDLSLTEAVFTWKPALISSGRRQHNTNMNICWAAGHLGDPALLGHK